MGKIINISSLENEIKKLRRSKNKIVLAGGCFDILHVGHIEFLKKAKKLNGTLLVMLESDEKIRELKGSRRPVNSQIDRAYVLAHLKPVDLVLLLPYFKTNNKYFQLVNTIKPDIIALTKDDPVIRFAKKQAKEVGAKLVEVIERKNGYSTGEILEKLGDK